MKKIMILLFLLIGNIFAYAQKVPYRVVFDLTSKDAANYTAVLRQIKSIMQERPDAIYEIISRQREGWGYIKVAQ